MTMTTNTPAPVTPKSNSIHTIGSSPTIERLPNDQPMAKLDYAKEGQPSSDGKVDYSQISSGAAAAPKDPYVFTPSLTMQDQEVPAGFAISSGFVFLAFPALILLLVASVIWFQLSRHYRLPTLEEYKKQHPSAAQGNGISCAHCGSKSIFLWWMMGPKAGMGPKRHTCRGCGTNLYRS